MSTPKKLTELNLRTRPVLVRVDYNVPLEGNVIKDDTRIRESIPTLQYLLDQQSKLILCSHLGRPDGKKDPKLSLEPVATALAEILGKDVVLAEDSYGEGIELMVHNMKPGQILMLENLRFHPEEEANDPHFSHHLARLGQVYVSDAFGTCHRAHASTYGVPSLFKERGIGFLIEKELKFLDYLLHEPERPFCLLLGGAKVSDKIKAVESLLSRVQIILVGGAMAYAFKVAQNEDLPPNAKVPKNEDVAAARSILREASRKDVPVILPIDYVDGYDIGPKSVARFKEHLSGVKSIFWNGPLGWFEREPYNKATNEIAEFISQLKATKIVGGGDTVSAIKTSGFASGFSHLSTGGGAALEYLEGQGLPGIEILKLDSKVENAPLSLE